MSDELRVLCVHGVGRHEQGGEWEGEWRDAIERSVHEWDDEKPVVVEFLHYDDIFAAADLDASDVLEALGKLLASGIFHGIGDFFRRRRGILDLPERVRWTAGMVVQWAENDDLREQARDRVVERVGDVEPDVVCAHSLGSLITYDTFIQPDTRDVFGGVFMSFGSQIGNPFVRSTFGGRLVELEAKWFHLFNRHDDILTTRVRVHGDKFDEVDTHFDIEGIGDHKAPEYLSHENAINRPWKAIVRPEDFRGLERSHRAFVALEKKPERRALLVGINEYPNPAMRLAGCVNDTFLISGALQESGFAPEDIRVVLDERATAQGILERLEWLLDGAGPDAERVLYYSGHGAQVPAYGVDEKVDKLDECLVPVDFDWSRERAVTDDEIYDLYTQLPYETRLLMIFDCCHSGGLTRGDRIRGIDPPDDIRHRRLKWDANKEMWVQRELPPANKDFGGDEEAFAGESRAKHRLGRALELRTQATEEYDETRERLNHHGPYMPVILQACQEDEYAYEYRHGVTSYGAFTYSLVTILRRLHRARKTVTFEYLVDRVRKQLRELDYDQRPVAAGPTVRLKREIPWRPS